MREIPPAVTKRNHFTSLRMMVEDLLRGRDLPAMDHADAVGMLEDFGRHLIRFVAGDLERASAQGIDQGVNLILDPGYYETKRRRRTRAKERDEDYKAKQERESWRRRYEPTPKEIARDIEMCEKTIDYHARALDFAETRMSELRALAQELPAPTDFDDDLATELKQ